MTDDGPNGQPAGPAKPNHGLTDEQIVWAYRVLFDRDPESEKTIMEARSYGSMQRLRNAILASAEFRDRAAAPVDVPQRLTLPGFLPEVDSRTDEATAGALLARIAKVWEALGDERPHWSVLSADAFSPERIAENEAEFYRSGATDAARLLATLARVGVDRTRLGTLFEFGCGIGRVTPHLAREFPRVEACDVSPSHIRLAEATIKAADIHNVAIARATIPEFGMLRPFDVWYSRIVLQHNPPPIMRLILERALDLLTPRGAAVFQIPTYARGYRFSTADYLMAADKPGQIEMHALPQPEVFAIARRAGCTPLAVIEDDSIGLSDWISTLFAFRKDAAGTHWRYD